MSRARLSLIVLAFWAAIYLPGLGTLEIKGEEGRRILPAVTMLQTGNFIVPQVGSDPYFNKPPLVNWFVAGSFKLFGARNELAARMPSALCVLAVAIAFVTVARRTLGPNGSLIAALVWMTNFGMIEKGRLIEIEALYASLCGLAVICWLSWWQEGRSKWLTWILPWMFLGLGLLAKGPLHLVFFYAVVACVLYQTRELRMLWNSAHLLGVALMLGIFAAWAIPCLRMMDSGDVAHVWARQFSGRLTGEDFELSGWLLNIPRGLGYFLPWTIMLFLFGFAARTRRKGNVERRTSNVERRTGSGASAVSWSSMFDVRCSTFDVQSDLAWSIGVSFLGVSLLPGALARYTMPLLAPAAWLTAMLLTADRFALPRWLQLRRPAVVAPELRLPIAVALAAVLTMGLYTVVIMPFQQRREKVRTLATQINGAVDSSTAIYAVDPDYQPFLFYVRSPIAYMDRIDEVPPDAKYLLVRPEKEEQALRSGQWQPAHAQTRLRLKDYRGKEVTLLEITGAR